jgi:hypothetical protein
MLLCFGYDNDDKCENCGNVVSIFIGQYLLVSKFSPSVFYASLP